MYPAVPDRNLPSITPLTARSVALSTLLGYHPPALPISALVKVGELFGIRDRAIRVALTRMVRDADVTVDNGMYRLSERLLRRQAQQDALASPPTRRWTGGWEMAVVTSTNRPLSERVALRKSMVRYRVGGVPGVCGCGRTTSPVSSTAASLPTSASFLSVTTLTRRAWQRRSGTCQDGR